MAYTCFGILILSSLLYTVHTLTCLSCTESNHWTSDCRHNFTTCKPDEQCFLEQIRNSTTHRRTYTAGCRSNHLCNLIEMLGGNYDSRRNIPSDRTATICSECCATYDNCNDRLCYPSNHHFATTPAPLQCIQCSDVSDIKACKTNIVTCGSDEECFMEVTEDEHDVVRYNAGCKSKLLCAAQQHSSPAVGRKKRELALDCFGCCSNSSPGHTCNAHLCGVDAPENKCLNCGLVSSVGVCHNTTFCQPTEVCYNSINHGRWANTVLLWM
ncbi:uncharacterized protein [Argopecten irradians]|uniref:uncharacterized protein n=1 Tax=Argopecten irradians TaxID=31199 RepID=UPI00371AF4C4